MCELRGAPNEIDDQTGPTRENNGGAADRISANGSFVQPVSRFLQQLKCLPGRRMPSLCPIVFRCQLSRNDAGVAGRCGCVCYGWCVCVVAHVVSIQVLPAQRIGVWEGSKRKICCNVPDFLTIQAGMKDRIGGEFTLNLH